MILHGSSWKKEFVISACVPGPHPDLSEKHAKLCTLLLRTDYYFSLFKTEFNRYLSSSYHVLGTVINVGHTGDTILAVMELIVWWKVYHAHNMLL